MQSSKVCSDPNADWLLKTVNLCSGVAHKSPSVAALRQNKFISGNSDVVHIQAQSAIPMNISQKPHKWLCSVDVFVLSDDCYNRMRRGQPPFMLIG